MLAARGKPGPRNRWRLMPAVLALALAVPVLVVGAGFNSPASAANVTNTTIHVPASVQTNPCFPTDVVNLSGDIHIVITTTADSAGGYRVDNHLNSQLSGVSITTGTKYVNSENQEDEWYARPPFPTVHTHTYDFLLLSQSNTPNYVLHMTMHETVDANGVPTATVDKFSMDCQG
jgi:hypothetical protein